MSEELQDLDMDVVVVEASLPGERLDTYLRTRFPEVSRATLQKLIDTGDVLVNGKRIKQTHSPKEGDLISVTWPPPRKLDLVPEELPLNILFEDEHLLVLNKAAGMVVHPGAGNYEHTLVNALLHHCEGQLSGIGGFARPGIVHRLDKDTSGCIVVAKTDPAHQGLASQFREREVQKIYHAILCGEPPRASGEIEAKIARHKSHRQKMTVAPEESSGKEARTTYRILERLRFSTLVEVAIHTGRTHQIRVHFKHLGFPLAGDSIYGGRENLLLKTRANFSAGRQLLHAFSLSFCHPASGERMTFQSQWPEDFESSLRLLRIASSPGLTKT